MGILRTNEISGLETPTPVTGSVVFDGSGDRLILASSGDFELGNGSFTLEAFVYGNSWSTTNGGGGIIAKGNTSSLSGEVYTLQIPSGVPKLWVFNSSGTHVTPVVDSGTTLNTNTWYHLAVTRDGNTTRIFIDGVLKATSTENYTINTGTALYTSDFTPPVHELQPIGDTVLLCCNNPDSARAEATGKTITIVGDAAASTFSPGLTRDFTSGTQFEGVAKFDTQGYFVPPSGTTEQRGRGRGVISGNGNTLEYIQIDTQGNAQDFGDLTYTTSSYSASCASSTRGLIAGGFVSPNTGLNTINAITISTTGNAIDFGDIPQTAIYGMGGCSSSTRGLFAGGYKAGSPNADAGLKQINYVTIASLGDAQDFGDLTSNGRRYVAATSSPTRGVFAGGRDSFDTPLVNQDIIDYVTIATLGNAADFGNLAQRLHFCAGTGSPTRGVFGGGYAPPSVINTIQYITISTTGNTQDFGDLLAARGGAAASSNTIKGTFAGGGSPSGLNTIDYVTIASTGNAQDFGDMITASGARSGCSDSHGGIS
jgi:hypothetical protein